MTVSKTKQPAVLIIVRHGARLDSIDSHWHLTSPTPYDPPLTYGGWMQSRALGKRIAEVLDHLALEREQRNLKREDVPSGTANSEAGESQNNKPRQARRRRWRIAIHSSPFLRCVQTSIAIAAGINLDRRPHPPPPETHQTSPLFSPSSPDHHYLRSPSSTTSFTSTTSNSSHAGNHNTTNTTNNNNNNNNNNDTTSSNNIPMNIGHCPSPNNGLEKCKLRLDAFLSEWLPHEYFEHITPPPESVLMLAGAKAELLRRADPIETGWSRFEHSLGTAHTHHHNDATESAIAASASVSASSSSAAVTLDEDSEEELSPDHIVDGVPFAHRDRSATSIDHRPHISFVRNNLRGKAGYGGGGGGGAAAAGRSQQQQQRRSSNTGRSASGGQAASQGPAYYTPPTPAYAISLGSPIPLGYVAHARDACVGMDVLWDSMREPLEWGGGGELGEEWSSMHNRFSRGLKKLVAHYSQQRGREEEVGKGGSGNGDDGSGNTQDEEEDVDDVVILVSHGAGCNALIGALTDQPVLMDVPMTSLTLAVRKDEQVDDYSNDGGDTNTGSTFSAKRKRHLSNAYDVRLMASTQHLRPPPPQSSFSRSSSTSNRGSSSAGGSLMSNGSFSARRRSRRPSGSVLSPSAAMNGFSGTNNNNNAQGGSGLWGNTSTSMQPMQSSLSMSSQTENSTTTPNTQSSTLPSSLNSLSIHSPHPPAPASELEMSQQKQQQPVPYPSSSEADSGSGNRTRKSEHDDYDDIDPLNIPPQHRHPAVLNDENLLPVAADGTPLRAPTPNTYSDDVLDSRTCGLWACPPLIVPPLRQGQQYGQAQAQGREQTDEPASPPCMDSAVVEADVQTRERTQSQGHVSKRRWTLTQVTDEHGM